MLGRKIKQMSAIETQIQLFPPSGGKWEEGLSPSFLCLQHEMPPSCVIMPPTFLICFATVLSSARSHLRIQNFHGIDLSLCAAICVWCLFKSRRKRLMW